MLTELISFQATDGFPLDGLVYTPEKSAGNRAALLVHGKVMNFYTGPGRDGALLAQQLGYFRKSRRTYTPYGFSPVEECLPWASHSSRW